MRSVSLFLPMLLAFAGCDRGPDLAALDVKAGDPSDLDKHLVMVDGRGAAEEPREHLLLPHEAATETCDLGNGSQDKLLRARFACIIGNMISQYERWRDERPSRLGEEREPVLQLLVYFNGGLNDREDAVQTAADSYRQAEADGFYPLYMVWPTGALRTYGEDVAQVRQGRWTPWQNPWTLAGTPLRPPTDLIRGIASTPAAWGTSFRSFAETGFGLGTQAYAVAPDSALLVRLKERITADQSLSFSYDVEAGQTVADVDRVGRYDDGGGTAARLVDRGRYVVTAPLRALSTPLMIGLGEAGWRNMVRRTRISVRAVPEFPPDLMHAAVDKGEECRDAEVNDTPEMQAELLRRCYPRGAGGFSRFFQWLESCTTGQPITPAADPCPLPEPVRTKALALLPGKLRITMVGHSMGAIVVNELIQLYPDLPYENLVYMAGAASVRDTSRATVLILRANRGCTKLYALMLHPMNEAREPTFYGLSMSGSLLTYVDDFLEQPKTLPDRTVGQWHNLRQSRHLFPADARRWMHMRVFDREAGADIENGKPVRRPNPTTHGAFNDARMPFWKEWSFWKPGEVYFDPPDTTSCEALFSDRFKAAVEKARGA